MSSIYSEIRNEVKACNKKLIYVIYTPEIYRVFKVIQEDHPGYERKRYTYKKLDGTPLYTESKFNEMKHSHRYKRLIASDLIKVDKKTTNITFNNDRANPLNRIKKLVNEKPIIVNVPTENNEGVETDIVEPPQQIRKSTKREKLKHIMIIIMINKSFSQSLWILHNHF